MHDLKRNLRAWEAMCQAKDQQIAMLMERCRRLQEGVRGLWRLL